MLKVYEKPKLVALSISGYDMLCTGCPIDQEKDPGFLAAIQIIENMGLKPFWEIATCSGVVTGYCKFNGGSSTIIGS